MSPSELNCQTEVNAIWRTLTLRQIKLDTGGVDRLALFPFVYRKAGTSPIFRKWPIPFGVAGYVALFEIEDASTVTILAVRHQLQDNCH